MNKDLFKFISKEDKKNCELILQGVEILYDALVEGIMFSSNPDEDQENIERLKKILEVGKLIEAVKENS